MPKSIQAMLKSPIKCKRNAPVDIKPEDWNKRRKDLKLFAGVYKKLEVK